MRTVQMLAVLKDYLEDYNAMNTSAQMNLVLFMDAVQHVCRISRVIRQPLGNALLLGVGGSGRQSLSRLATHMAEYDLFQIELTKNYGNNEWRDDLKKIMMKAGLENKPTVFLFPDTQVSLYSAICDPSAICCRCNAIFYLLHSVCLNSGCSDQERVVPGGHQQHTQLGGRAQHLRAGRAGPGVLGDEADRRGRRAAADQEQPVLRVHAPRQGQPPSCPLHEVSSIHTCCRRWWSDHGWVSCSPIGEIFRARLRQFPALVNCCTIDWFSEWPDEALQSVASSFLQDMGELEIEDDALDGLVSRHIRGFHLIHSCRRTNHVGQ